MERIRTCLASAGVPVSDGQLSQLETYMQLVIEKNKVMNLTAITEREEFITKHLIDSLAPLVVEELRGLMWRNGEKAEARTEVRAGDEVGQGALGALAQGGSRDGSVPDAPAQGGTGNVDMHVSTSSGGRRIRMIDVGTGAGFPGIPLKILCPDLSVTLLDSLRKRVDFLQEVIDTLQLSDITTVHMRAEEGGQDPAFREKYDLAVSRAVANLSMLAEYDLPFVRPGGTFLAYKSGDVADELRSAGHAIHVLGGHYEEPVYITLPDSDIRRAFVLIRKEKPTPKQYPRKAGTAKKNPL